MQSFRTLLVAFVVAGTAICSHHAVAQSFGPPVDYPSGGLEPGGGSVADFNEDGRLDVINGSFKTDKVSLLLGTGDGGLQAPVKITVGFGPVSTAVADLNHDGHMDFVVALAYAKSIAVCLGKGDGTFQATVFYPAGSGPAGLAIGDYNSDGHPDVAVADVLPPVGGTKTVQILYGLGDGKLAAAVPYDTGATKSFRIAAGDFNADGILDLVVTEQQTNLLRFLAGQSDGTFITSSKTYSVPADASFVAVADFNRDGRADLAVTSAGDPRVSIFLGQGDFNFNRAPDAVTGAEALSIAVADFNGDGFADFVVESFKSNTARLHVFTGNGDGTFGAPVTVEAGSTPVSVVAGDLNSDGKPDLLSLNGSTRNTISVYLNTTAFPPAGNLVNVSTRLRVSTEENVLIAGLIVQGSESKRLIVRAIGPDLVVPDSLQDPTVALVNAQGTTLAFNDNWRSTQEAEITQTGIAPQDDRDAALIFTVAPGAYTAVVKGASGTTGVGLVEAYDLATGGNSHFVNVSTRGFVSTEANVMIGGFIVPDGPPAKVVIRALGPSLTRLGVAGALEDPTLELRGSNGAFIRANDNWRTTQPSELFSSLLAPPSEKDSAVLVKLPPGAYTAILRGKNSASGVGLLEVFRLP